MVHGKISHVIYLINTYNEYLFRYMVKYQHIVDAIKD